MDDLASTFMPRFMESARRRIARARAALQSTLTPDRQAVSHELHALAGEAAVLELTAVADLARVAEAIARRWSVSGDARDAAACHEALVRIDDAVNEHETK
jgi:HPt (histidine-containing phosphotransfer) domain-containing protein